MPDLARELAVVEETLEVCREHSQLGLYLWERMELGVSALAHIKTELERLQRIEKAARRLASYKRPFSGEAFTDLQDAVAAEGADRERPEGREGMVTVYDDEDRYLGCMGRETWEHMLAEGADREAV